MTKKMHAAVAKNAQRPQRFPLRPLREKIAATAKGTINLNISRRTLISFDLYPLKII